MEQIPFGLTLKNTLKAHIKIHNILNDITKIIKSIHSVEDMKNDPELLLLICNLIENMMKNNKSKLDKKELALSIHDNIFTNTDNEREDIKRKIQFFYDNGKIKKKNWYKLVFIYTANLIKRWVIN